MGEICHRWNKCQISVFSFISAKHKPENKSMVCEVLKAAAAVKLKVLGLTTQCEQTKYVITDSVEKHGKTSPSVADTRLHKNHLVRFRKTSRFGFKYLFWFLLKTTGDGPTTLRKKLSIVATGRKSPHRLDPRSPVWQPWGLWKTAENHILWMWYATFGANFNLGRICGL